MSTKVLVTYASRTGSTAGIAEAIGKTLTESSLQVDVKPMQEVNDLSAYQAVVAGSAIQGNQWLPEAMQFMQSHRVELAQKPCAIFMVCMTLAMKKGDYSQQIKAWLNPVRQLVRPVSEGYFRGVLDLKKIPSASERFKFKLSVVMGVWSEGDHREWDAIRTWTKNLPLLFAPKKQID